MKPIPRRQNYLGASGWVWAGRYQLERYLYLFHRLTGLGILLFLLIHLVMTTVFRIQGKEVWETTIAFLLNPWFKVGEYLVVIAFIYHGLNGLRLVFQEMGFALGRPTPPIYPYKDSLRKKRPWTIAMMVLMAMIALVFLYDFIAGGW
jgi:succinate dehydrogenase / fumarate reductase cytochrome b subunit